MAINFPTSKDTLVNPQGSDNTVAVDHALQHSNANDAIEALETKVGIDSSADTTSIDYKLKNSASVNPGHKHSLLSGISDVAITTPSTGNGLFYNEATGKWENSDTTVVDASSTVKGVTKLSVDPESPTEPISVGTNDTRVPTQDENDALSGTGTPSISNKFVTEDTLASGKSAVVNYQSFTSSGTWTKPSELSGNELVFIQAWGGGGGGGGAYTAASTSRQCTGGGGGGGAYSEIKIPASELSSTETVTIGVGGGGGVGVTGGGNTGTDGGTTSFGTRLYAYGGGGGYGFYASGDHSIYASGGGGGGTVSAGSSASSGGGGSGGEIISGAGATSSALSGNSIFGGGGGGAAYSSYKNGGKSVYGGGGGGGYDYNATGGNTLYGGGGGGTGSVTTGVGVAGISYIYKGNGGAGGYATSGNLANGSAGTAPSGGGGGGATYGNSGSALSATGGAGARGEVRIWVIGFNI